MLKCYSTGREHFESEIEKTATGIRGSGPHMLQIFSKEDLFCVNARIVERSIQLRAIKSLPFVLSADRKDIMLRNANKNLLLASTMTRWATCPGIVEHDVKKTLF